MLFCYLLTMAFSKGAVPYLTNRTFESMIEKRQRSDVCLVLFMSSVAQKEMSVPISNFMNASKISMGLKFSIVDISRYPDIALNYEIEKFPAIQIFYDGGNERYVGRFEPSDIVKKGVAHLNDFIAPITEEWKDEFIAQPSAMLFAETPRPSLVWKAISAYYFGKSIRIGFTNNSDLFFPFDIKKAPAILFANGTHQKSYKGKMNFNRLTDAIDRFFARSLSQSSDSKIIEGFASPKRFRELCIGSKTHCVVIKAEKATPEIEQIRKSYHRLKMNWILGQEGLPYDFMKKGQGVWVYNPRRDAFVATEIGNLEKTLEDVLNGGVKWTKRDVMNKEL
ncbi:hypothetical protein TRFO_23428 [Tritrichomonas foetus]|uniref:Thioredoxin domain-containing protein n=1 Tax=Tritrichomonas foetus TaxID=1144522 RepID=A0A1J4KAA1_9EUKA|nr:hypothetical protein TRFO_23428 [Tritrichomonas foetus]|eukprot:OHT08147.1 hypothetical protein TRFO_23428 [Tritrichomonas foetus]